MSNPWLRLYVEILDDPKVQRLDPPLFKLWINLLCAAGRCSGLLPPLADLAFMLRRDESALSADVDALVAAALFDRSPEGLRPHNWEGRQYRSDSSTERVKRHRNKQRNVSGNVSGNGDATKAETAPEQNRERNVPTERFSQRRQPRKDAAAPPPQVWVLTDDRRWPQLVAPFLKAHPGRTHPTTVGAGGMGWHFDAPLVLALAEAAA